MSVTDLRDIGKESALRFEQLIDDLLESGRRQSPN